MANVEKKIWIITELYYPTLNSTGYYMTEIAEYLAKNNQDVNVLCSNLTYNTNLVTTIKSEVRNKVRINRVLLKQIDKNNFIFRILRLTNASIKLFIKSLLLISRKDRVLIVTNPAFLILLMPMLKLIKGIKYDLLVHDIFPENLVAIKKMKSSSLIYKLIKFLFDFSYSKAENCIVIGRDMEKIVKEKIGDKSNITLIPNWAEVDKIFPVNKNDTNMINLLNLQGKFIFQFAGNLGHAQGLKNILDAISLIKNEHLHFLFIGSGAMESEIKLAAKNSLLKNISLIGFQDRSNQNDFLNACDVALITLSDGMLGLGVPSKAYNIMAAGKPILIIADNASEISMCVKEYNLGWIVEPNNPKLLSDTFEMIYKDFSSGKVNIENSRIVAEKYFAKDIILSQYDHFIK